MKMMAANVMQDMMKKCVYTFSSVYWLLVLVKTTTHTSNVRTGAVIEKERETIRISV